MGSEQMVIDSNRASLRKLVNELLEENPELLKQPDNKETGSDLLGEAIRLDDEKVIELLVKFGLDLNFDNPLEVALKRGSTKSIEVLLKNGAKLEGPQWKKSSPAETVFLSTPVDSRQEALQLLVEYGLDTGFRNDRGQNLLHLLAYHTDRDYPGAVKLAELLLGVGVPLDEPDRSGLTPLFQSFNHKGINLTRFLLTRGADLHRKSRFQPLHKSIELENEDLVELVLSNGFGIEDQFDYCGWRALHVACKSHHKMIALLLQKGADVSVVSTGGYVGTPLYHLTGRYRTSSCSCEVSCVNVMIKEITKRKFFDSLSVSELDLDFIRNNSSLRDFFEKCELELFKLASVEFHQSYCYCSVFVMAKDIKKLAKLAKNKKFVENFREKLLFPMYGSDLQRIFNEAVKLKEESQIVFCRVNCLFGDILPDVVLRKVAKNLTLEDVILE